MVVLDRPEFHRIKLNHRFAIATHEVTIAEFHRCKVLNYEVDRNIAPTDDCPMHRATIFQAAEYCNWLSQQNVATQQLAIQVCVHVVDHRHRSPGSPCEGLKLNLVILEEAVIWTRSRPYSN